MKKKTKGKSITPFHTAKTKIGSGDYYGEGVKNPVGKIREQVGMPKLSNKKLGKAPKSLA